MLVVLSDTHGRDDPRLEGRTREAVDDAEVVVHAGDFCTEAVLDAFESRCDLRAVSGNNDSTGVRDRIPAERVVEWDGLRLAVVHGHDHTDVALTMFARQSNADLVVVGHSHRPGFEAAEGATPARLNPGSHAEPRRYRPAHAELRRDGSGYAGRIVQPDGTLLESFRIREPGARDAV